MDNIVENMAEYICDHICQKAKETTDQEEKFGNDKMEPVFGYFEADQVT